MTHPFTRRLGGERGTALLETAITLPLLLLASVAIFEFGRAFQTWEVLTNAAREGARVAVLPSSTHAAAEARARAYLDAGALNGSSATMPAIAKGWAISIQRWGRSGRDWNTSTHVKR